jgi:hypothetical protein
MHVSLFFIAALSSCIAAPILKCKAKSNTQEPSSGSPTSTLHSQANPAPYFQPSYVDSAYTQPPQAVEVAPTAPFPHSTSEEKPTTVVVAPVNDAFDTLPVTAIGPTVEYDTNTDSEDTGFVDLPSLDSVNDNVNISESDSFETNDPKKENENDSEDTDFVNLPAADDIDDKSSDNDSFEASDSQEKSDNESEQEEASGVKASDSVDVSDSESEGTSNLNMIANPSFESIPGCSKTNSCTSSASSLGISKYNTFEGWERVYAGDDAAVDIPPNTDTFFYQRVDTVVGQWYELRFALRGSTCGDGKGFFTISSGEEGASLYTDQIVLFTGVKGWETKTRSFITSNSEKILIGFGSYSCGIQIDDISLLPIDPPASVQERDAAIQVLQEKAASGVLKAFAAGLKQT